MKKFLVCAAIAFFAATHSFAFSAMETCDSMKDDKILLKAGVGLGFPHLSKWGFHSTLIGLSVPIEFQFLLKKIPLGICARFTPTWGKYADAWGASDKVKGSNYAVTFGVDWHFNPGPEKLDLYAGLGLGFKITTIKYKWNEPAPTSSDPYKTRERETKDHTGGFAYDIHTGVSYYFTKAFGINAELGWPTLLAASAAFKF